MSDTVKLIIEIPKEDFKKLVNPYQHNEIWCNRLKRIVMNGTPLDDDSERAEVQSYFAGEAYGWEQGRKALLEELNAEVDKAYDDLDGYDPSALGTFANRVSDILNNIGKAESED